MDIADNKYKPIEAQTEIIWGNSKHNAIASWGDGYDMISAVEDDKCIVFILHSKRKPLEWIPAEIIKSLLFPLNEELRLSSN